MPSLRMPSMALNRFSSNPTTAKLSSTNQINVKAFYIARGIDILKVHASAFGSLPTSFQSKSLTITIDDSKLQYITVFKYGSVVLFNIPNEEHKDYLANIQKTADSISVPSNLQHTEEYDIIIDPTYSAKSIVKSYDQLIVKNLDYNHVQIVGSVMAQTVALDYYAVLVDQMVETFMEMNLKVGESGDLKAFQNKKLVKLIASNNTVIMSVISKMGIFEGSDAAWDDPDAWETWDGLRRDFELDDRFKDLSLKLEVVKENTKFFLDILHNEKSKKLEWIIIILISAEIVIGLTSLSQGLGH